MARAPLALAFLVACLRPALSWNQYWENPSSLISLPNSGSSRALAVASLSGTAGVTERRFVFDGASSFTVVRIGSISRVQHDVRGCPRF